MVCGVYGDSAHEVGRLVGQVRVLCWAPTTSPPNTAQWWGPRSLSLPQSRLSCPLSLPSARSLCRVFSVSHRSTRLLFVSCVVLALTNARLRLDIREWALCGLLWDRVALFITQYSPTPVGLISSTTCLSLNKVINCTRHSYNELVILENYIPSLVWALMERITNAGYGQLNNLIIKQDKFLSFLFNNAHYQQLHKYKTG